MIKPPTTSRSFRWSTTESSPARVYVLKVTDVPTTHKRESARIGTEGKDQQLPCNSVLSNLGLKSRLLQTVKICSTLQNEAVQNLIVGQAPRSSRAVDTTQPQIQKLILDGLLGCCDQFRFVIRTSLLSGVAIKMWLRS